MKLTLDETKNNPHLCSPQGRKRKAEKLGKKGGNGRPKIKKNKIWELKKGSYLCTPETNEGNFGKQKGKKLNAMLSASHQKV